MSYEIKQTGMMNHIEAFKRLESLVDALIRVDTPATREFVARNIQELRSYLAREIGLNVLQQMKQQDLESDKADEVRK